MSAEVTNGVLLFDKNSIIFLLFISFTSALSVGAELSSKVMSVNTGTLKSVVLSVPGTSFSFISKSVGSGKEKFDVSGMSMFGVGLSGIVAML